MRRSGGTRAKLNLGLALLPDPAGFDWETYLCFWQLTAERRTAGRAVLIISHFVADDGRRRRLAAARHRRGAGGRRPDGMAALTDTGLGSSVAAFSMGDTLAERMRALARAAAGPSWRSRAVL